MSTLKGKTPKETYGGLLKLESVGLTDTLKRIESGFGEATPIRVSTEGFEIHSLLFPSTNAVPGRVLAVAADGLSMEWIEAGASGSEEPTAKGTIKVSDGENQIDLPIGNNGQVLMADSTKPSGVKWGTVSSGGGGAAEVVDAAEYTYNEDSSINTLTEHIGDNTRVTVYTYYESGQVHTVTSDYMGAVRQETYTYVNGRVVTMTATNI
jgi:hypothetical protein